MILKKIRYIDIKDILEKNSLDVKSEISDDEVFVNLKTIANSSEKELSFFSNIRYIDDLKKIKAKACLIEEKFINYLPSNCYPIIVEDPYFSLALVSGLFNNEIIKSNGIISNNTSIDLSSKIQKNVQINSFTSIFHHTEINEGVYKLTKNSS